VPARSYRIKHDPRRTRRRIRGSSHAATIGQRRIACMLAARPVTPWIWRRRPHWYR